MTTSAQTRIGLAYATVEVVDHQPGWARIAGEHAATVGRALGGLAARVEHVGSTAVPGLAAKPIVDLAVQLVPGADPGVVIDRLNAVGYRFRGDKTDTGGLLFVCESAPKVRIAHVHVLAHGDAQWDRYLAVRDRLRARPDLATEYGRLKHELAGTHSLDRAAYTAAKGTFLRHLLAELPSPEELQTVGAQPVAQWVRAVLITPNGKLLAVRRTKPGQDTFWVLAGGGIEPGDASLEDAAHREIGEEVGGRAALHALIHVANVAGHTHAIFLGRIDTWDADARTGPEVSNADHDTYGIEELPLDPDRLGDGRVWPVPTMRLIAQILRDGGDLFALPDLREHMQVRWRSGRAPQSWEGPLDCDGQ